MNKHYIKNFDSYNISQIYEFWFSFYTVLYKFLETGTSDRTNIGRD